PYPWGSNENPGLANIGSGGLRPASDLPGGASPSGALNMVGNAWEFVQETKTPSDATAKRFADLLSPPPSASAPWYTIRGESYLETAIDPKVLVDSTTVPARWKAPNIGFRCVKDAK